MTLRHPVIEVFGPTIQGEGALAGSISHFVRFGGCDFRCAWCDSAPAVLPELVREAPKLTDEEITVKLAVLGPAQWVTLSGGNPALHDLGHLVDLLHEDGFKVAVETQGSFWRDWLAKVDLLTVSPKPPSSGMKDSRTAFTRFIRQAHDRLTRHLPEGEFYQANFIVLKVPVWDEIDLDWAQDLHLAYPAIPFYVSVVTAMGGLDGDFLFDGLPDTQETLLDRYAATVKLVLEMPAMADVRIIPQLHVLVWGHQRGH